MKRCDHRIRGSCYLRNNGNDLRYPYRFTFRTEDDELGINRFQCTDEFSEICEFRIWEPKPKHEPKPVQWIECSYCGGRHRTEETANTCKFYRMQWASFETQSGSLDTFKEEGSTEPWPPIPVSLHGDWIWKAMVPLIIKRDLGCCTDCGISYYEMEAMRSAHAHYYWEWPDQNAHHDMLREVMNMTNLNDMPTFEVHHIIPRVKGGTHHPHNLRLLCSVCHRKYTNELMEELASERKETRSRAELEKENRSVEEFKRSHPALESYDSSTY